MTYRSFAGFTLIELVTVIVLLSILSLTVMLNWPGTTLNLDAQAQLLVNDLRYTQSLSMTRANRYRLVKTSATTYQIMDSTGAAILFPSGNQTTTLGNGIVFGQLTNLANNLVAFDGKGIPYIDTANPGTALSNTATITLSTTTQSKNILIYPLTGSITVS